MKKLYIISLWLLFLCGQVISQPIQDPDDFHGPRTKWVIYPDVEKGISRHSIIPQVDISIAEWYRKLEELGANAATINLEARNGLSETILHPTFELTPQQIARGEFTPEQRDEQLIDFLKKINLAIENGEVNGNIRFHVHQRLYPRKKEEKEDDFITDFSDFINKVKAEKLDHLLAGIRLGEHGEDGRNYLLDFVLRITKAINNRTNGWLKTHGFEMSGDQYGRYFVNIHNTALSSAFFEEVSKQTGYFSFCYKAFGVGGALSNLGFSTSSEAEWETGLLQGMGIRDLITFIHQNRDAYPLHANVIFIGDSGDALKLVGNKEYKVTTKLLCNAGVGFSGIIGVNGYRRPDKTNDDNYLYFYDALNGKEPDEKPKSIKRWQAWPLNDAELAGKHTVLAMSNLHGIIEPSGPILVGNNDSLTLKITPQDGYQISKILVNNEAKALSSILEFDEITQDMSIQVLYEKVVDNKAIHIENNSMKIYPNPANHSVNIEIEQAKYDYLKIMDLHGSIVSSISLCTNEFNKIDITNINDGLYLFQLINRQKGIYETVRVLKSES